MGVKGLTISYLIAAHNESEILESSINKLVKYLAPFPNGMIYILENGSRDATFKIAKTLEQKYSNILVFQDKKTGMGYAHHRGILESLGRGDVPDERHWLVLNSADLPFGDSDLQSFNLALKTHPSLQFIVGSKCHFQSRVKVKFSRRAMSQIYQLFRSLILRMKTKDSQGVLFIRADLARKICHTVKARDFFHMTELVYRVERLGVLPFEVPVIYSGSVRPSKVRPIQDATKMMFAMLRLRNE